MPQLDQITFQNSFVDALPGETTGDNRPRQTPGVLYARVAPTPVRDPQLLAWSDDLGASLGLARPDVRGAAALLLGGNAVAPTMKPFAARYGGHQFGSWAGQLGDGRAISLGEIAAPGGALWEIQLKGAGPTPYSRRADGRAVLRSSLREFLCSEAMFHLGVPTTRALSLVGTGETVVRDMFYDGNPEGEPGAVVARVAPTFVRFGSFEILTALGETENLRLLADYVIRHHYAALEASDIYARWFEEICLRTAVMIAHWMTVGFVHGVMNTDNLSILGVTIDYGPYGWLEPFDPDWTPNTTDFSQRRYAFGQQPQIGLWNLQKLAGALAPLVTDGDSLRAGLETYAATFNATYRAMQWKKLGLRDLETDTGTLTGNDDGPAPDLVDSLPQSLFDAEIDLTLFFRQLSHTAGKLLSSGPGPGHDDNALFDDLIAATTYAGSTQTGKEGLKSWLARYAAALRQEHIATDTGADTVTAAMLSVNPKYVLRNYLAQNAIESAEQGDLAPLNRLMTVLKTPFAEQPEHDALARKRPDWARDKPGSATLSCSS